MPVRHLMLACLLVASLQAGDRDWSNFRGNDVSGIASGSLFTGKSNVGLHEAWRTKIGSGYTGITVQGDAVVTSFQSGDKDVLAVFDASTGRERWRLELEDTYKGHDGSHDGPLMTPTIAGDRVFAIGAKGRFVAANLATGKILWETNLVEDHDSGKPHYGFTTSPLLRDGVLVLQLGAKDAALAGFDPDTGKKLWTAGEDAVDYQSPVPFQTAGGEQIVAACRTKIFGVDAKTGKLHWEFAHEGTGGPGAMSIVPVVTGKDTIFLAHKQDGSCQLKITPDGDSFKVEKDWDQRTIRNSYNVPIYLDGHIYAYSSRFLTCVDASTGKSKWRSREPGDGFMSLIDGHLVIATKEGGLHVVKATPDKYEHVAGTELFENLCWNSAAIANGAIYVRSLDELVRIDVRDGAAAPALAGDADANTQFGAFLQQVAEADDKQAAVDSFMGNIKQTPLVEGQNLVHFLYQGDAKDAAVGSELFGARQERAMKQVEGTNLWYLTVEIEPDARVNYVLLTDFETGVDPKNERTCRSLMYGAEMEMNFRAPFEMSWFAMPEWQEPAYLVKVDEGTGGKVEDHELESEKLGGAKIPVKVYVPAGYPHAGVRYPVAYVHGGRAAMSLGKLTTALDHLVGKQTQPMLVVFFDAQSRGRQDAYADMVASELIPLIDKTYPTLAKAEGRANLGHGFAGMDAMYTGLTKSELFGKLGTQSAFAFGSGNEFDDVVAGAAGKPIEVYMEWGKYDLRNPHEAWDLAQVNRDLAGKFRKAGFSPKGGQINTGTGWANWSTRYHAILGTLFPPGGKASS